MTATSSAPWPADARYLQIDDLLVDLCYRRILHSSEAELPQRIFDLLLLLMAEPHRLHTRAELFERLWPGLIVEDANLSQSMWLLRKALGPERKHWIRTVAKGGYVFEPPGPVAWSSELPASVIAADAGADSVAEVQIAAGAATASANTDDAANELIDAAAGTQTAAMLPTAPSISQPPGRFGLRRHWKRWAMFATAAMVIAAVGIGAYRQARQRATLPPALTVALVTVEDPGNAARWPAQLLYQWLYWKLNSLPEVTVLTEAELAAGAGSTSPQSVFLASGEAADGSGKLFVRARFQHAGREQHIELEGKEAQMPALVDALSQQVLQRLIPARSEPWPALKLDAAAARRYVDATEAMRRRDWMKAAAIGEEVVRLAPRFGLARIQLADAQSHLAQAASAVEQMDVALDLLRPTPPETTQLMQAQRLSVDPRRQQEAVQAHATLAARYPHKASYAIAYANLLTSTGSPLQALDVLTARGDQQAPIGVRIARRLALAETYGALGDPGRKRENAKAAARLADGAGAGWELEKGAALFLVATADSAQRGAEAGHASFEEAARLFDQVGNSTGALYARFLAEVHRPSVSGDSARLDTLLAQANAGGYRRLEISILLQQAAQRHGVGDLAGYRHGLEQAAGVAQAAGDVMARNSIDILLLNEDFLGARLGHVDARLQRLRQAGLQGQLAVTVEQLEAALSGVRGNNKHALVALDRAAHNLPRVLPGEAHSAAQARLACVRAEHRLPLGELAGARSDLGRCATASEPSTQVLVALTRAHAEQLAGDRAAAGSQLRRAQAMLPGIGKRPDHWLLTLEVARLLTRLGDSAGSDQLLDALLPTLGPTGYALLIAMAETSLAENAAVRGDWDAMQRHADAARQGLPADAWFLGSRLDLLDAAAARAAGNRPRAIAIAAGLHEQAHRLGDAVVQMQVHSLLSAGTLPEDCSATTRETLIARTGMRGATLDWLEQEMH
ncbi:transcriptional regulator [Luteimonas cucumeris]|uniref:Transcriptional regulator n=1 Tax=Luteimonas cucumeris TaxID=985012 RepID=A0A562L2E5_9GAMM|nr:winged helix-turn-helix domain-containing protein [Luteimonas cucumeris]TWI01803.1 transcriptional regulator [Luteimonas cucumeris]